MDAVQILRDALTLISDEDNWCQRYWQKGNRVCAIRAVDIAGLAASMRDVERAKNYLGLAGLSLYGHDPVWVNDMLGHSDVLVMYKQALADLEEGT